LRIEEISAARISIDEDLFPWSFAFLHGF